MNPELLPLFERMNGAEILPSALKKFNKRVMDDPLLKPLFQNLDEKICEEHQKIALMFAMGGSGKWEGRTLRQMHSKLSLEDIHFDTYLNHLIQVLQELNTQQDFIEEAKKNVETTRREVLNVKRF